jgi:tRNA 2-selenouridine synthase
MSQSLLFGEWIFQLKGEKAILIDVRSPGEYAQGHIPGAFSLPLFSDEERKVVGTLYKQESQEKAFLQGLDFVGPKMSGFVVQAKKWADGKKIFLYCWRGGMRSQSMAWLLKSAGLEVFTLKGGYKNFRKEVLERPLIFPDLLILGGFTGSRKSQILRLLKEKGQDVIDLEALAHHKGSAFGGIGEGPQPTQEQFENELFLHDCFWKNSSLVWLEDESKAIGKLRISNALFEKMRISPLIFLKSDPETRVRFILENYGKADPEDLRNSILKLKKRLGGLRMKIALEALDNQDIKTSAAIILEYYDQGYSHGLMSRPKELITEFEVGASNESEVADSLIHWIKRSADSGF